MRHLLEYHDWILLLEKSISEFNPQRLLKNTEFVAAYKEYCNDDAWEEFNEMSTDSQSMLLFDVRPSKRWTLANVRRDVNASTVDEDWMMRAIDLFLTEHLTDALPVVYDELRNLMMGGSMTIYRGIEAPTTYLKHLEEQGKHIGIYWTHDPEAAKAYGLGSMSGGTAPRRGKESFTEFIVSTTVQDIHINWFDTLMVNCNPKYGSAEKEIRLFKGTPLKIEKLVRRTKTGKEQNLNIVSIQNKTFYA